MQNHNSSLTNYAEQIRAGLDDALGNDPKLILMGLGVTDPKGVFGTTIGLVQKYGKERVLETPTSENAVTGVGVGLAITGHKSVMVHQRLDFFLLAMDQLVNSAAKWHYMYGGQQSVPITIRLITGRGWGQGPTHSQNLHSWFTHIPGLKVVMPAFANEAKELLRLSIADPNPVVFLEDRWCHVQEVDFSDVCEPGSIQLGQAEVLVSGASLTVVSAGFGAVESFRAIKFLKEFGLSVELINLRTLKPLDTATIFSSVNKTGKILVVDSGAEIASFGSEVISQVSRNCFSALKSAPQLIAAPDVPEPTSHGVTEEFKFDARDIAKKIIEMTGINVKDDLNTLKNVPHDAPNSTYLGPF
jgi:acetoin:2,6-dichlorophenolindophenol oxidoreductase subunit beta